MNANYLKEVVRELKLSTFPTQNTVLNFTIFVILFTLAVAAYLGALDVVFGKGTVGMIEVLRTSDSVASFKVPDINNIVDVASTTIDIATTTATSTN